MLSRNLSSVAGEAWAAAREVSLTTGQRAFRTGWRSQRTPSIVTLHVGLLRARGNGEFYGRRRDV